MLGKEAKSTLHEMRGVRQNGWKASYKRRGWWGGWKLRDKEKLT